MKKIFLLLIICILLSTMTTKSYIIYHIPKNDNIYNIYTISIENLNTKNFTNYFQKTKINKIYPKINPIYKNMIGNISYKFKTNNINQELNTFKKSYLKLIKKNSYTDYNYIYVNGINIEKVEIQATEEEINKIINETKAKLILK